MQRHDRRVRELAAELFEQGYGYKTVSASLGISQETVREWLRTFKTAGAEELLQMGAKHRKYTYELKVAAARAIVDEGLTRDEVMRRFSIASISPLKNWCRAYREGGAEALRPKARGRPKVPRAKPRETTREEELEARVRYLEAENAYLKKLAALKAEKRLRAGRNPR